MTKSLYAYAGPVSERDQHPGGGVPLGARGFPGDGAAGNGTGAAGGRGQRQRCGAGAVGHPGPPPAKRPGLDLGGAGVRGCAVDPAGRPGETVATGGPESATADSASRHPGDPRAELAGIGKQLEELNRRFNRLSADLAARGRETLRVSPERVWRALRVVGVGVEDLRRRDRTPRIAYVRILVMWLLVRRLGWTQEEAAVTLRRHKTAVGHAVRRGNDWWDVDREFRDTADAMCRELGVSDGGVR